VAETRVEEHVSSLLRDKNEKLFAKKMLGKVTVDADITVEKFKERVWELISQQADSLKEKIGSIKDFRLRNPKNDDLGEVMTYDTTTPLDSFFLFDGKQFLVQKSDLEVQPNTYNILVREWNPATWEFGTLYEI